VSIELCPGCGCRFAVGLLRCPQCQAIAPLFAERVKEEEGTVPRITVAGGPSNAAAQPGEPGYVQPEGADAPLEPVDAAQEPAEPDVSEPADGPADGGDAATDVPHEDKPVADLKAELRDRGLPVSGSKEQLVARLVEHDQAQADAPADDTEDPAGD
jgi:hypothetical protein